MNFKIQQLVFLCFLFGLAFVSNKTKAHSPLSAESQLALHNLQSDSLSMRTEAIVTLKTKDPQLKNPVVREKIVALLQDPSDEIQKQAVWALRDINDPDIEAKILDLLSDSSSPLTKKLVIFALADNVDHKQSIQDEKILSGVSRTLQARVLELLSNPIPTVRQAVVIAFSGTQDPDIQEQIARRLSDSSSKVRRLAILALRDVDNLAIQQKMAELLSLDESPEVREAALFALRGAEDLNIQARILKLLSNSSSQIRASTIFALRGEQSISSRSFLDQTSLIIQEKIVEALSDPADKVRQEARLILNMIENHSSLFDQLSEKFLEVLPNMDPEGKISIMNKLVRQTQNEQGGPKYFVFISDKAQNEVTKRVLDPDFEVKTEALRLLFFVGFTKLNSDKLSNTHSLKHQPSTYDDSIINQFLRDYFLNSDSVIRLAALRAYFLVRFHFKSVLYPHDLFIDIRNFIVDPLLSDPQDEVRIAAMQVLKFDLPKHLVPPYLIEFLKLAQGEIARRLSDKHEEVRLSAVLSLNPLILSPELLSGIRKLLLDTDERVRLASVRLITKALLFQPHKVADTFQAQKDLGDLGLQGSNFMQAEQMAPPPPLVKIDDFKKSLMYLLSSDPSPEVRLAAAQALSSVSLPEIEAKIAGQLSDKHEGFRLSAVRALRDSKDSTIHAQLEQVFLQDPSLKVKRAILSVFGPLLISWDRLEDIHPDIRDLFIQKTVEITESQKAYNQYPFSATVGPYFVVQAQVTQNLLDLLSNPIPEMRKKALRALQNTQNPRIQERISDMVLSDTDSSVKAQATDCLRAIQRRRNE